MAPKEEPEELEGTVTRSLVRRGTASEHHAVVLCTDNGEELILQRIGGNAFDDPQTIALVGARVAAAGYRLGRLFRYVSAERVP